MIDVEFVGLYFQKLFFMGVFVSLAPSLLSEALAGLIKLFERWAK